MSIYDFTVKGRDGSDVDLSQYKGKVLVVVNTASKCGFTPQFAGLQNLYDEFHDEGLEIIGFPCNQFANQDPGSNDEIAEFCQLNYGVTFPMMSKIDVKGSKADPVFKWLTAQAPGLLGSKAIKWNFTKFLVGRDGEVIKRFGPKEEPEQMKAAIHDALAGAAA